MLALADTLKTAIITAIGQDPSSYDGGSALTAHTAIATALTTYLSAHVKANISGVVGNVPTTNLCSINFFGGISVPTDFTDFNDSLKSIVGSATLTNGATVVATLPSAILTVGFDIPQTFTTFDDAWSVIGSYIETWVTSHPSPTPFSGSIGGASGTFNITSIVII